MGIKKGKIKITKKPVSGGPGGFKPTTGGPMKPDTGGGPYTGPKNGRGNEIL